MRSSVLHEVKGSGTGNGLRAALHAQFTTEVIDVAFDRVHAHDEAAGDLAIGSSCKQQAQHLSFALGEWFDKRTGTCRDGRGLWDVLLPKDGEEG